MAQADKSRYYRALKAAGVPLEKHYRDYTNDELIALAKQHTVPVAAPAPSERDLPGPRQSDDEDFRAELRQLSETVGQLVQLQLAGQRPAPAPLGQGYGSGPLLQPDPRDHVVAPDPLPPHAAPPEPEQRTGYMREAPKIAGLDTAEHAGLTSSTHGADDALYTDEQGNVWYQREVRKPAFPKPRGRRVLRYDDPGVRTEEIKVGDYTESFEVAGDPRQARTLEARITLPSYQTGIYKSPNLPFKVHTYNGARGFDLEDVQRFYGAADLVPDTIKKVYVSTDMCYDIPTTIRAIKDEARELSLRNGQPR